MKVKKRAFGPILQFLFFQHFYFYPPAPHHPQGSKVTGTLKFKYQGLNWSQIFVTSQRQKDSCGYKI